MLSKVDLKKLSKPDMLISSVHMALRLTFHLGCIVASLLFYREGYLFAATIALLPHFVTSSFLGWAGIGHELFHKSVFPNKKLNTLLFRVFSIYTWSNYSWFEISHPLHHRLALAPDDLERPLTEPISWFDFIQWLTIDISGAYRRVLTLFKNATGTVPMIGSQSAHSRAISDVKQKRVMSGARVVLITNSSLALGFVLSQNYWLLLVITLAPFCITFFNKTLALSQHYGLVESDEGMLENSCRTVMLGKLGSFFYANMNYHIEHHYFPSIPFYNLSFVHKLIFDAADPIGKENVILSYYQSLRVLRDSGLFRRLSWP